MKKKDKEEKVLGKLLGKRQCFFCGRWVDDDEYGTTLYIGKYVCKECESRYLRNQ